MNEDSLPLIKNVIYEENSKNFKENLSARKRATSNINIEVAVFFDEAAYKIFAPYLKYDENRLTNMLLAYMNGVR